VTSTVLFRRSGWGGICRKRKGFGENKSGLEIGCRAELETFFAVDALRGGYLGDEPYLPSGTTLHKSHRTLLLDLSTVSHTQAAKNAERGLFFKTVSVRSVLLSQILQLGRARSMSQQKLQNHFADFIHLLAIPFEFRAETAYLESDVLALCLLISF